MFCAISGEPPSEPVVSIKSGHLYEKRLILKYLGENSGKDPITGEELDAERDLVQVKADPKVAAPRPPQFTSIPSLLTSLQNEYDSILFETLALKKQYDAVRQELASALYSNDAANRVIARLLRERDEARQALANIGGTLGNGAASSTAPQQDAEMADDAAAAAGASSAALPEAVVATIEETAARLSSQRKNKMKRKAPAGYSATAEGVASYGETRALTSMHSTKPPGVSALALSANGNWALTGGEDKVVQIYDRGADKVLATLKGHTKRVTHVVFQPPHDIETGAEAASALPNPTFAASASEDKTVKIWGAQEDGAKFKLRHNLTGLSAPVTGLAIHPSGQVLGAASRDGTWALFDVESGEKLLSVQAPAAGSESEADAQGGYAYESLAFHPDGQLLATGTQGGAIRIWTIQTGAKAETFQTGLSSGVTSLDFSQNGYYLAAASAGGSVAQVWDLRKLSLVSSIDVGGSGSDAAVSAVRFDPSAQLLAVVGTDAKVYANKSFKLLYTFSGNAGQLTSADWDAKDGSLVVASLDRTVRVLGAEQSS